MKKEYEIIVGKYIAIAVFSTIAMIFIMSIIFGINEMKQEAQRKQDVYDYLDRMCKPLEYGVDQKPTKYSCDDIIFNK